MTLTPEQVAKNAKAGTQGEWEAFRNSSFWEVRPKIRGENDPFTISDVCASEPENPDGGRQEAHARRIASVPDMEALIAQQAAENERLREALKLADDNLTNLQPKIANGLVNPIWLTVFDGYIEPVIDAARAALSNHQAEIAAVLEKAAEAAVSELHIDDPADYQQGMLDAEAAIRALIPDDVAAALQAEKDAARRDGIAIALKAVQQERREYPNNNPALPMDGVFNDIEDAIRQLKREVKK